MTWTMIPGTRVQFFLVGYYPSIGGQISYFIIERP
jgi:hypothetical protein